eukprot:scaffold7769_cov29-Prasinocladus_malaysianus.AAC.1
MAIGMEQIQMLHSSSSFEYYWLLVPPLLLSYTIALICVIVSLCFDLPELTDCPLANSCKDIIGPACVDVFKRGGAFN